MAPVDPRLSPALYPIRFDPHTGAVHWIELDEAGYKAASFLDERLLLEGRPPAQEPWSSAENAAGGLEKCCNFIFHIGHVGSTLLSRLLDEHPAVMSVREPAILRTLAAAYFDVVARPDASAMAELDRQTDVFLRLFARTWRADQTALIKATSFVSGMASHLLQRAPGTRAVCLTVTPMTYLRGILGGPARTEAPIMAMSRLARLSQRLGEDSWTLGQMSEGEVVAMSWLCEMTALHDASKRRPGDVLWFDFDQLLASPQAALSDCFAHLSVAVDDDTLHAIAGSTILRRYSKATDHAYSAQTRRDVLRQAEQDHGAEVRKGVEWLGRTAQAYPIVREVLIDAARIKLSKA